MQVHYLVSCLSSASIYSYDIHTKTGEKNLKEETDSMYHSPFPKQYKMQIMRRNISGDVIAKINTKAKKEFKLMI